VSDNILFSLTNPRGVIALASAMVLVHVLGSYQVRASATYQSRRNAFCALALGYTPPPPPPARAHHTPRTAAACTSVLWQRAASRRLGRRMWFRQVRL